MENQNAIKLAILIDAENISQKYTGLIIEEAQKIGTVIYKRIFADWSDTTTIPWKQSILEYSLQPVQQFKTLSGKNSSDFALVIEAMDLLHANKVDGFCIVSSDSDFTRLATRLRESEMLVIGMGEQKTPNSLISACDKFLYLDLLLKEKNSEKVVPDVEPEAPHIDTNDVEQKNGTNKDAIKESIQQMLDEDADEEVFLGTLGSRLYRIYPDFDPRNFGFKKLNDFIESFECFQIKSVPNQNKPSQKLVYVKKSK